MQKPSHTFLLLILAIVLISRCEEATKPDTTPPTVTVTSPTDGSTVSEIVTVSCISTDDEGVAKVELWVDGLSTELIDETEPYSFKWNTTIYEDSTTHTITVRSYDLSENKTDSDPITVIVDNQSSFPQSVSITTILFEDGGFSVRWTRSVDDDFKSYILEHSVESLMGEYEELYTTEERNDTTYFWESVNPLIYHYFRVTVTDTFNYKTKSSVMSSSLDPIPTSVNVISVTYDLTQLTVTWEKSTDADFREYKVLYSEIEGGDRDTLSTISDISVTSYTITAFDPTHENWFWILVFDTLGQISIGKGESHIIDPPPTTPDLSLSIEDNNSFLLTWSQTPDDDFVSYSLFESRYEDLSNRTLTFHSSTITDISYTVIQIALDDHRYYELIITDFWGRESSSGVVHGVIFSKIVFQSERDGDEEIYIMNVDGSNHTNVSNNSTNYDGHPQLSPDGTKIVFRSRVGNGFYIYIMDSDGSNLANLTPNDPDCYDPIFSPDGTKIVFPSRRNGNWDIYIMDTDGSNEIQLTSDPSHDTDPNFSPDGLKIVFLSKRSGYQKVYVMNSDGSQQTKISDAPYEDHSPSFSPTGDQIVFRAGLDDPGDIYIVGVDGSGLANLTNNNGFYDYNPSITPDGQKIVFSRKEDGQNNWNIHIMNIDGTGDTNLTNNFGHSQYPKVNPDGTKILYLSLINNDYEVYIMNIDGTDITNLTNSPGVDENPQFQPQP